MPTIAVTPNPAAPGEDVNVDGAGFDPKYKFALTTVDSAGTESGFYDGNPGEVGPPTNINRPRPDGTFRVGIKAPPREGASKIRGYKVTPPAPGSGDAPVLTSVAEATVTVRVPPIVTPPPGVPRVTTIPNLLNAMADDDVTEVILSAVTHAVTPAANGWGNPTGYPNSLWIGGDRFARRTKPLIVRWDDGAKGVLDGGGAAYFGGTTFADGVHDIDWRIGRYDYGNPTETGVIVMGGYRGLRPIRNITLRDVEFLSRLWSHVGPGVSNDHLIYFSYDAGTGHVIDRIRTHPHADPSKSVDSVIHFYHGEDHPTTDPNADGVTIRNFDWRGQDQPFVLWDASAKNVVLEDGIIDCEGAGTYRIGIRWERGGPLTLRRVQTKNTVYGFYSENGKVPVYDGCRLDPVTKELVLV